MTASSDSPEVLRLGFVLRLLAVGAGFVAMIADFIGALVLAAAFAGLLQTPTGGCATGCGPQDAGRQADIPAAAFLPTHLPRLFRHANLRNHRKILVVDGAIGFTGGMNIRDSHWLALGPSAAAQCLHFRVAGPVVANLQRTLAIDWAFTTGEHLDGEQWFPQLAACGTVAARGVVMGKHGRSGIEQFLVGSVTSHLVRPAPCDVLVVPETAETGRLGSDPRNPLIGRDNDVMTGPLARLAGRF